jgi:hypothetical protein
MLEKSISKTACAVSAFLIATPYTFCIAQLAGLV